jgi:hypothetical protein
MVDLSHACVMCQSTTALNTRTTIKVTEDEYQVSVCSVCEDNASPKLMRASLIALLERLSSFCKEATAFLGIEVNLAKICCPSPAPAALVAATVDAPRNPISSSQQGGGVRVVNRPIQRDQRRNGNPPPQAARQKVAAQPVDAAGKPLSLPKDIVVLENAQPVASHIGVEIDERMSFKQGYNTCHHCNGEGGTVSGKVTSLCPVCGGSGLL